MDCTPSGSSIHGILQARRLEWVAVPSSRGSSWPRNWTHVYCGACTEGGFFTVEPPGKPHALHTHPIIKPFLLVLEMSPEQFLWSLLFPLYYSGSYMFYFIDILSFLKHIYQTPKLVSITLFDLSNTAFECFNSGLPLAIFHVISV